MTTDSRLEALRGVRALAALSQGQLRDLAESAVEDIAAPGDVLTRESELEPTTALVLIGEATVVRGGDLVARLGPGDVVAPPDAPPATVTAVKLMHLLVLRGIPR